MYKDKHSSMYEESKRRGREMWNRCWVVRKADAVAERPEINRSLSGYQPTLSSLHCKVIDLNSQVSFKLEWIFWEFIIMKPSWGMNFGTYPWRIGMGSKHWIWRLLIQTLEAFEVFWICFEQFVSSTINSTCGIHEGGSWYKWASGLDSGRRNGNTIDWWSSGKKEKAFPIKPLILVSRQSTLKGFE